MRWLSFAILLLPALALSTDLEGKVVAIADGDTFTLLTSDKREVKIRLAEIDAPESGQAYGNRSKQVLASLIFGEDCQVRVQTKDRYGRTVGRPFVGQLDISAEMVRLGAAWVYRQYVQDKSLFDIESDARNNKRGLWGITEVKNMPPWEWRRSGGQEGAPEGCTIKGNINSKGEKIYHMSGVSGYGQTRIDESKGERWFCSEEEAKRAGWRARR